MPLSLTISERSCASRFCSTTKTKSWSAMKLATAGMEREGADPQPVELMAAGFQHADRLVHRRRGRAEIDHAVFGRLGGVGLQRPRHQVLCGLELAHQPLHVVGVDRAFLGIARVAVARGAAGEVGALGRVGAGIGAVGDAVAVDVEIAAEVACRLPASRRS